MAQYQSFPGAAGDSHTLEKLKALRLPSLIGKRFLDVGCNEGFFCGYAAYDDAARSVGLDQSSLFIGRARQRFPQGEFFQKSWEQLPDGPFDVILLASALHYADDQAALIHSLMDRLAPDGILVLELGIASSPNAEWVRVTRGIDQRYFPSMPLLRELLEGYAWKWMGPSVSQDGDPVNRHVIHISRPRPMAYLLMQPPAYGKTSIAKALFARAGVPVVSGDNLIALVASGKKDAPEPLRLVLTEDYSPYKLDEVIRNAFESGQGEALVRLWAREAGEGDFALDVYVPQEQHALVEQILVGEGYMPITLRWDRVGASPAPAEMISQQAEAFYMSLAGLDAQQSEPATAIPEGGSGFVDELALQNGQLVIRGWAADPTGGMPDRIGVRIMGRTTVVDNFDKQLRPDVERHLALPHGLVGYRIVIDVPEIANLAELRKGFEVFIPSGAMFQLAEPVIRLFNETA